MDSLSEETKGQRKAFPLMRYCYFESYRGYYPFGNIPAEDFLQNCAGSRQPSVLALGCGDLRSCFYTLWKHFDSSISTAPKKFDGVCFTLNDCSAAILARNIIFLYLCLQLPDDSAGKKKWLCAIWAIWYCHELSASHLDILDGSLKTLVAFSKSTKQWCKEDNPLHQLVRFSSSACLSQVAGVWAMWLNKTVDTSPRKMRKSRNEMLGSQINSMSEHSINLSKGHTRVHGEEDDVVHGKGVARAPEVRSYLEVGSCYAEDVVGLTLSRKGGVNLTMYERPNGEYCCHYGLMPFECYYQTVEFSPRYLKSKGVALQYDVIVPSASFGSKPFLANSFQQFAMWIQSSSKVLKNATLKISFIFNCQDAIAFCQQKVQHTSQCYDIITTSNLTDHISPANLVLACVPLMKVDGLLATTTMCCKNCTNTGEEFMNLCFGFSSRLFPVVLGVRCISHEGSGCSNSVMINPSPPDISHIQKCLPHVRTFLWAKVSNAQKLVLSQLPPVEDGNITEALVNLVGACSYALLNYGPGQGEVMGVLSRNGIETAMGMLDRFKCLSNESTAAYSYWQPLCTALKCEVTPFLHCLQTQALLHGIHAHLTVSEEDCPVCLEEPLASKLGFFYATIGTEWFTGARTPYFVAFLHQCPSKDADVLQRKALEGEDVHIFDCFDAFSSTGTLQLKFFAPLILAQKGYQVTVAMLQRTNLLNMLASFFSAPLKDIDIRAPWSQYVFCQVEKLSQPVDSASFGTIVSHVCDGFKFETEISLSEATLQALSTTRLSTDRVSCSVVRLSCNSLSFQLNLSYPIDYSTLNIKVFKSKPFLSVCCERQPYNLEEERPCFTVSPDHRLSILPTSPSVQMMLSHSSMQLTMEESHIVEKSRPIELPSGLTKVKLFLKVLFEAAMSCSYFSFVFDSIHCLVVVNDILFDYQHKTPTLDLAFCLVDDYDRLDITKKWESLSHSSKVRELPLEEKELGVLKEVLVYFSRRTNGTVHSAGSTSKYALLQKFDLDRAFTRCVLYFLLCDPDVKLYASGDFLGFLTMNFKPNVGGSRCTFCGNRSFTTKKCGRCRDVKYCSKYCQTKHWKSHQGQCKLSAKQSSHHRCTFCQKSLGNSGGITNCTCVDIQYCSTDCQSEHQPEHRKSAASGAQDLAKPACSFCNLSHSGMKKCLQCGQAQYCDQSCQRKHWPEHKKVCVERPPATCDSLPTLVSCSFCNKSPANLKKCTRCGNVQYCSRDCQAKHWPEHKRTCADRTAAELRPHDNSKQRTDPLPLCSYCKNPSDNLKNCAKCGNARYCNRDCQTRHWPEHKKVCAKTAK